MTEVSISLALALCLVKMDDMPLENIIERDRQLLDFHSALSITLSHAPGASAIKLYCKQYFPSLYEIHRSTH